MLRHPCYMLVIMDWILHPGNSSHKGHHLMAVCDQLFYQMAADETIGAGYQNLHHLLPWSINICLTLWQT